MSLSIVPKQCVYTFTRLRAVCAATARLLLIKVWQNANHHNNDIKVEYTKYEILSVTCKCRERCKKLISLCQIIFVRNWQIHTNSENFWHKDGKEDKLMRGEVILHLNDFFCQRTTVLNLDE